MTEEKKDYITEAMDLLHGTTLEISSPEKVIERRDGKLVEVERSAFVKIFTSFKRELKTISGDELKVWLYLALSINRFSKTANPGLRKIAEDTGLAVNTVRGIVERLEMSQLLDVEKADGKGNQYRPADYASVSKFDTVPPTVSKNGETVSILEPTVSTLRGENAQLELTRETRKSTPQTIKGIEAALFSDRPVTNDDLPMMEVALHEFESALSLPANWNWYPAKSGDEKAWRELRDFIFEKWQADNGTFRKYATWRATPYVKGALSNLAIQRRPTEFITSWSDYLASSSMYPTERSKGFAL